MTAEQVAKVVDGMQWHSITKTHYNPSVLQCFMCCQGWPKSIRDVYFLNLVTMDGKKENTKTKRQRRARSRWRSGENGDDAPAGCSIVTDVHVQLYDCCSTNQKRAKWMKKNRDASREGSVPTNKKIHVYEGSFDGHYSTKPSVTKRPSKRIDHKSTTRIYTWQVK